MTKQQVIDLIDNNLEDFSNIVPEKHREVEKEILNYCSDIKRPIISWKKDISDTHIQGFVDIPSNTVFSNELLTNCDIIVKCQYVTPSFSNIDIALASNINISNGYTAGFSQNIGSGNLVINVSIYVKALNGINNEYLIKLS